MKFILAAVISLIATFSWAQPQPTFFNVSDIEPKPIGQIGQPRGIWQFEVSYHNMESNYSDFNRFDFGYFGWLLNRAHEVSANPIDTNDNNTMRWGAVVLIASMTIAHPKAILYNRLIAYR